MARGILAALTRAGVEASVVSDFTSRDGRGDVGFQSEKFASAKAEIERLVPRGQAEGWRVWVTYHNYYKAPDLLGPAVCRALDIPYIQIETTRARKRLSGPWSRFAEAAEAASDAATALLYMTNRDAEALYAYRHGAQIIAPLRPFLATDTLPLESRRKGPMLSVGMMRPGDKLASYRLIADALGALSNPEWHLVIAGDGPARPEIEALMRPHTGRITFCGALDRNALTEHYGTAGLLLWPGVNEAFGMTYLEAQAAGLAVVAQDRPGVRDVLFPGAHYPAPEAGAQGLAARLDLLLGSPKLTMHIGQAARDHVARHHLLQGASAQLRSVLDELLG
jgi:glycosyltransferase involved in cell wall biosynthesis